MRVLIIGGGISGLHNLLELIESDCEAIIVEREAFLGGNALYLYKYFPSFPHDCTYCVESLHNLSGIRKCIYRSGICGMKNVKIYTLSEVEEIKEINGKFKVKIKKKPRFVDESKCINCKRCEDVCDVEVSDERYGKRKAIYINNNGIPHSYVIDIENCNKCGKCINVCETGAINLNDKEKEFYEEVDRIIVATGFEEYKPYDIVGYKYGKSPFVITQMELAYHLSRATEHLEINGKRIRKIFMIQCVGSRDEKRYKYCSKICCNYALKHSILLKELDESIDIYIAFMDIRSYGFYEFWYNKSRELGVKFIRGRPGEIVIENDKLKVFVENTLEQRVEEYDVDLVVLSSALIPNRYSKKILDMLGVKVDEYGFVKESGVYVKSSGCANRIMDVPESVISSIGTVYDIIGPEILKEIVVKR